MPPCWNVDMMVLEAIAERRAGSNPVGGTKFVYIIENNSSVLYYMQKHR